MKKINQPNNPSDEQRYALLKSLLTEHKRLADFPYIIRGLNPPEPITNILPPGSCKGLRIGILGGGVAGLVSAYELQKLGCSITLYEGSNRLGGQIYTYYFDKDRKLYGELGAMRIPISHQCTWHYINELGLKTQPFIQSSPEGIIYIRDIRIRNREEEIMREIYPQFDLRPDEKRMTPTELINKGLYNQMYAMKPSIRQEILYNLKRYSPQMAQVIAINNRQAMEGMSLSLGAIQLICVLNPIIGSFLYNCYSEVFQENYTGDFEYLYEIKGGTSSLIEGLAHGIESSGNDKIPVKLRMNTLVKAIDGCKQKSVRVVSEDFKRNTIDEDFDYVICTIPYPRLRTTNLSPVLTTDHEEAINEVSYEGIQKTILLCNQRFWLEEGIKNGGSITDKAISTVYYPNDGVDDPSQPGVLLGTYSLGMNATRIGNLPERQRIEVIKRQLEEVHGLRRGALNYIVSDYKTVSWGSEPLIMGICYYRSQQKKLFGVTMNEPSYNNRLFYAGNHLSSTHGWIQGAIKTSLDTVNKIGYCIKSRRS